MIKKRKKKGDEKNKMIIVNGELFLTKEEDIINQKTHRIDIIIENI